jgi:hypothetical protein
MPLPTILLLIALLCFVVAAIGVTFRRINFIAAGLAFATASVLAASNLIG